MDIDDLIERLLGKKANCDPEKWLAITTEAADALTAQAEEIEELKLSVACKKRSIEEFESKLETADFDHENYMKEIAKLRDALEGVSHDIYQREASCPREVSRWINRINHALATD